MARNLRILRKQDELSQEELAFHAGINQNYVGQIERKEKSPTVDVIDKLATALEIDHIKIFLIAP